MQGLDMVRRDWCGLSHDVGYYILGQILGQTSREDLVENCHEYLQQVAEDVKGGRVAIDKYIIHKGLTKKPEVLGPHARLPLTRTSGLPRRQSPSPRHCSLKDEGSWQECQTFGYHPVRHLPGRH